MSTKQRIALFPGSFDPFTIGHYDIVERSLPMFDKIIIAIGYNSEKSGYFTVDERL
jgi:pantetheine-phosphate adenylyltransferase